MTGELRPAREPTALPVAFESLHAAALGGALHVVGLDEGRHARHLAVDETGHATGPATELPLVEVTGIAACGAGLVLTGVTGGDRPAVLRLKPDGRVAGQADVPTSGRLQYWPRPACAEEAGWLLWTTSGSTPGLHFAELTTNGLATPTSLPLEDDSDGLDAIGMAAGLVIARVHGGDEGLELLSIAGGTISARVDVVTERPAAPSLAHVPGALALAWVERPGQARLQWFDAGLHPLGAPEVLAVPPPPATLERVQLMASAGGALAVLSRCVAVVDDGRRVHQDDGTVVHRDPRRARPLWIAGYDRDRHRLGPAHLVDADAQLHAGAWLDGAAAVVHRGDEARVTTFVTA
jgi:hypothetical protein